jgi:glycosyltransferase involved in cell wall biosynthesis
MSVRLSPSRGPSDVDPATWPTVSVIVPTRDRPEELRRAVRSVFRQRYPGRVECVVVFDQSDGALPQVDQTEDRTLVSTPNGRSPGLAGARNAGAALATGELLAFCDDDDEWMPDKLRLQVDALRAHPEAIAAASGIEIRYDGRSFRRIPQDELITFRDFLASRRVEINPCTILVRRSDFQGRIGPVDESLPGSYAEDYDWLLRASRLGPIVAVPRALARINWHRGSWFKDRWETIAAALTGLLERHPELMHHAGGRARIQGQIAFAHAAVGRRGEAMGWAGKCLRSSPRELRGYLAVAVGLGLLRPATVIRLAHRFGKGI